MQRRRRWLGPSNSVGFESSLHLSLANATNAKSIQDRTKNPTGKRKRHHSKVVTLVSFGIAPLVRRVHDQARSVRFQITAIGGLQGTRRQIVEVVVARGRNVLRISIAKRHGPEVSPECHLKRLPGVFDEPRLAMTWLLGNLADILMSVG